MRLPSPLSSLALLIVWAASPGAMSQPQRDGFLCCNMRTDGSWISDVNYLDASKQMIAAGTPMRITGFGRWRVLVEVDAKKQAIGNDYSRTLKMEEFGQRYVVEADPKPAIEKFPARIREAIKAARIVRGMTREQVAMAVGYPIASATPELDAPLWRYWTSRSAEYQVFWGEDGLVDKVFGAPATRALVFQE